MSRRLLKDRARELTRTGVPKPMIAALIFVVLTFAMSFISSKLINEPMVESVQNAFPELFDFSLYNGDYSYDYSMYFDFNSDEFFGDLMDALRAAAPSATEVTISVILDVLSLLIMYGFVIFTLNIAMAAEASYWNLFDGFPMVLRIIWLNILQGIFILLWSLLFIVPGIIAMYSYRQANYLLVSHPELSARDCLRESKRLMMGHKWELFVLDLSFIGWGILVSLLNNFGIFGFPIFGAALCVWYYPFRYITNALYYKELTFVPEEEEWKPEF